MQTPWKFSVMGYNQTIKKARQREVVEGFSYMALQGRIDLNSPELELCCFEECRRYSMPLNRVINAFTDSGKGKSSLRPRYEGDGSFSFVWFGRLVRSIPSNAYT